MATAFHIDGPCEVLYDGVVLGITDNDDLPSFQLTQAQKEIKSVSGGDIPTAIFMASASVNISFTLVKWDDAVLNTLLGQIGGLFTIPAYTPDVGRQIVGKPLLFRRSPSNTSIVLFPNTMLRTDAISQSRFGNVERRLTLHGIAYDDPAGNGLFELF